MPVIKNNLDTEKDINDYKKWLSTKSLSSIKRIKKMLEVERKIDPDKWKNVDLRIELMDKEIQKRKFQKDAMRIVEVLKQNEELANFVEELEQDNKF